MRRRGGVVPALLAVIVLGAVAGALGTRVPPPGNGTRRTPLDILFPAMAAEGEGELPPALEGLRVRVTGIRRFKPSDQDERTWLVGRLEGPGGALPAEPETIATCGYFSADLGREPRSGRVVIDGFTGEFYVPLGTGVEGPVLPELRMAVSGWTGEWRTERFLLGMGDSLEKDLGSCAFTVDTDTAETGRCLRTTLVQHHLPQTVPPKGLTFEDPCSGVPCRLEAGDTRGPLFPSAPPFGGIGASGTVAWWGNRFRSRWIRWPVTVSVRLPRDPLLLRRAEARFVLRDVPLE